MTDEKRRDKPTPYAEYGDRLRVGQSIHGDILHYLNNYNYKHNPEGDNEFAELATVRYLIIEAYHRAKKANMLCTMAQFEKKWKDTPPTR